MLGKGFDKPWPFMLMSACLVSGPPPACTSVIWALNLFAPISCTAHLDQLPERLQIRIFPNISKVCSVTLSTCIRAYT